MNTLRRRAAAAALAAATMLGAPAAPAAAAPDVTGIVLTTRGGLDVNPVYALVDADTGDASNGRSVATTSFRPGAQVTLAAPVNVSLAQAHVEFTVTKPGPRQVLSDALGATVASDGGSIAFVLPADVAYRRARESCTSTGPGSAGPGTLSRRIRRTRTGRWGSRPPRRPCGP